MASQRTGMVELDETHHAILEVLDEARANPMLMRDETGMDKVEVNRRLDTLTTYGYAVKITHGLYRITEKGKEELEKVNG